MNSQGRVGPESQPARSGGALLLISSLWVLCWVTTPNAASAQTPTPFPPVEQVDLTDDSEPAPAPVLDPPAPRATPRSAMLSFLQAARAGDYERAAEFLDLSQLEDPDGPRLARQLKLVLDQTLWIELERISDLPDGDPTDGSPSRDKAGEIEASRGKVPVLLERSRRDGEWRIAPRTVGRIEALYGEFGLGILGEYLPPVMFRSLGELQLWQWTSLLAVVLLAYVLAAITIAAALRVARRFVAKSESKIDDDLLEAAVGPLTALLMILFISVGVLPLRITGPASSLVAALSQVFTILAFAWFTIRAADVASRTFERRLAASTDTTVLTIIPVGRRLTKFFLSLIAILAVLQNLGFNVLSIIAGLGVVGIGVALAAQKTFENFFGTISILIDQPIRRGDFCRFGDQVGTVEDIGLRSTRIRTLDRTIITLPNADFSMVRIENFTARDRIRFTTLLGLRYETTPDQMRHVLIGIKRLLVSHARVTPDPARVRFVGFGSHSLDLEIFAYVDTADWNEFLSIREDLLLRIMDAVAASGTAFAFPSQTIYLGRDSGLDAERARLAETDVAHARERRELALPDPTAEAVAELRGSIAYPPDGSAASAGSRE